MRTQTAWIKHLMIVKKENPKLKLKDVMKIASKTYKK